MGVLFFFTISFDRILNLSYVVYSYFINFNDKLNNYFSFLYDFNNDLK